MGGRKKLMFLVPVLSVYFSFIAVRAEYTQCNDTERLLDVIAEIESSNNPAAIGDGGCAIGVYQIHRPYWQDGTRILGVDWDYGCALYPEKSRRVVRAYLLHYGKGKSLIDMARIHNGGPKGYNKKSTLPYARKIEKILRREYF